MKAAIYMRVSKADGSQTTNNQELELRAYADRMGLETVEFCDHETGSHSDRDGLKALLAACSRKEVSQVLFWRLDRITRMGAREAHNFFHALDCWQIGYKSITDTFNLGVNFSRLFLPIFPRRNTSLLATHLYPLPYDSHSLLLGFSKPFSP